MEIQVILLNYEVAILGFEFGDGEWPMFAFAAKGFAPN